MRVGKALERLAALALVVALTGCGTGFPEFAVGPDKASGDPVVTGALNAGLTGAAASDPVSVGRRQYAEGNFGLAEENYRKAAELGPRDLEAWIGLAASYDRLKRFDLADRAYAQALRIGGRSVAILNNQGYSHMLRGDMTRARALLDEARRKDPDNPNVLANLDLLAESIKLGKDIR